MEKKIVKGSKHTLHAKAKMEKNSKVKVGGCSHGWF
jgi:hypothetical protein